MLILLSLSSPYSFLIIFMIQIIFLFGITRFALIACSFTYILKLHLPQLLCSIHIRNRKCIWSFYQHFNFFEKSQGKMRSEHYWIRRKKSVLKASSWLKYVFWLKRNKRLLIDKKRNLLSPHKKLLYFTRQAICSCWLAIIHHTS